MTDPQSNTEPRFRIDRESCTDCGLCAEVCLVYGEQEGEIRSLLPHLCIGCGHCEAICPLQAVRGPAEVARVPRKDRVAPPSPESLQQLLMSRRSVRRYKPQPLRQEDLDTILEAGRYTPTGSNAQNVRYVIVNDPETMAELRRIALPQVAKLFATARRIASLPFSGKLLGEEQGRKLRDVYGPAVATFMERNQGGDDRLFYKAPALMLTHGEKQDEALAFSSHMAMWSCSLMAHTLGVGCLLNSFFLMAANGHAPLRERLGLPRGHKFFGAMTMGYQAIRYQAQVNREPAKVRYL